MGWWKPYFFVSLDKVQVLFPWWRAEGPTAVLFTAVGIAAICTADRYAAAKAAQLRLAASSPAEEITAVAWWTAQRLTGGLVMLLMMTFNVILFLLTIMFLGIAELAMLRSGAARRADYGGGTGTAVAFSSLPQDDEDTTADRS